MTIVGTRPELIKLSRVIPELDRLFDHTLVHTGQNYDYELNEIFFEQLRIRRPDVFLNVGGKSAMDAIGEIISKSDKLFFDNKPDAVLILGDTNSSLAALPAKRLKIPIFHMEAGNRCYDSNVPEEINRKIVDHLADINLPYTQLARQYLLLEGVKPDQIIVTGSPMKEVCNFFEKDIKNSKILKDLNLDISKYFVLSFHREENVENLDKMEKLVDLLCYLDKEFGYPIIFSVHPRTRKALEKRQFLLPKTVRFEKPFGFFDYMKLQINSLCVLSDSGTITEESSIMAFDALNLREVHERPEGFEEGSVMMTGLDLNKIKLSLSYILKQNGIKNTRRPQIISDYDVDIVSVKIVKIIVSYINFVNRRVWHKAR